MSVITSFTAVPNRVSILYKFVDGNNKGIVKDDLKSLLVPPALQRPGKINDEEGHGSTLADDVIRESKALGLITETESLLSVPQEQRGMDDTALYKYIELALLNTELSQQTGQPYFAKVLAWFLCQDPAIPIAFSNNLRQEVDQECCSEAGSELRNAAAFQNFIYWAQYLGYAWQMQIGPSRLVVPDPTLALERLLPDILASQIELPVAKLMVEINKRIQVFEGGNARDFVEGNLPTAKKRKSGTLSKTTSLALCRLERKGAFRLESRSDAPAMNLAIWPNERPVSHVILNTRS
jgi:hypothetical protein